MSQFHNNNLLHNLRVGVQMIREGIHPDVASMALSKEGINAPAPLLEAAALPGVLDSMGAKPYTHALASLQIAAHKNMRTHLDSMRAQRELEIEAEIEEEGEDFCVQTFGDDSADD